jgi:hypothetical protein
VIDLDRASLDRVLPATPGPADWDDVMSRSRAHQSRRRRRVVALAAVTLVLVATATAFGVRALVLDKGFIGVPPDGATPSTPESGELVLTYRGSPGGGPQLRAWVYADGRLIWERYLDARAPDGKLKTGYLEQRLTPEGVELLLSEFISTGLFDRDVRLVQSGVSDPPWGEISVRNGNRLVTVVWGDARNLGDHEPTPELESALERLGALLVDPGSWLPASAWENREIRAYVPSRYEVCMHVPLAYAKQLLELSEILTLVPAAAADLLREAEFTVDRTRVNAYCSDITTEKAQAIAKALDDAGLQRYMRGWAQWYQIVSPPSFETGVIPRRGIISFQTYLPHGEVICEYCGG